MTERGFTLVELLVAGMVSVLVVGALVGALAPARAAFEAAPATLDLQQRSRLGLETLASAVRSAGVQEAGNRHASIAAAFVPAVIPAIASGSGNVFSALEVFRRVIPGAQGVLDRDQPNASGALTILRNRDCPHAPDVCGFSVGKISAISDGQGRFDIFEVAATDQSQMTLVPLKPLSAAYGAGAQLFEAEAFRYSLVKQPDGSKSLVRTSAAGATQPVVDGVTEVALSLWGEAAPPQIAWDGVEGTASYGPEPPAATFRDGRSAWPAGESCLTERDAIGPWSRLIALGMSGTVIQLTRSTLNDGPWCAGGMLGTYDADLLRLRRVDIDIRLEAMAPGLRGSAGQLFSRPGTSALSPARWVPDRSLRMSVSLRQRR